MQAAASSQPSSGGWRSDPSRRCAPGTARPAHPPPSAARCCWWLRRHPGRQRVQRRERRRQPAGGRRCGRRQSPERRRAQKEGWRARIRLHPGPGGRGPVGGAGGRGGGAWATAAWARGHHHGAIEPGAANLASGWIKWGAAGLRGVQRFGPCKHRRGQSRACWRGPLHLGRCPGC